MKKVAMAYVVCIGHCNLFSTIAEGFRTHSPFGDYLKGEIVYSDRGLSHKLLIPLSKFIATLLILLSNCVIFVSVTNKTNTLCNSYNLNICDYWDI